MKSGFVWSPLLNRISSEVVRLCQCHGHSGRENSDGIPIGTNHESLHIIRITKEVLLKKELQLFNCVNMSIQNLLIKALVGTALI